MKVRTPSLNSWGNELDQTGAAWNTMQGTVGVKLRAPIYCLEIMSAWETVMTLTSGPDGLQEEHQQDPDVLCL
jgi:hypothetical protein